MSLQSCLRAIFGLTCALFLLVAPLQSPHVLAADAPAAFPSKPVRMVVAYPPGGATDLIARVLAKQLSATWGQNVLVDTRAGASGMLGAEAVVRADPDGYTLLLGYAPEVAFNKLLFSKMSYDPITDLTPIALTATAPLVLAAGPKRANLAYAQLRQFKSANDPLTYGTPGAGGQQHVASELLARELGIPMTHVPYKGTGPAVVALLGGQIDLLWATAPPVLAHIRSGKLRALAVAGPTRDPLLPDVPTTVELGSPRLQIANWFGLFGPKGMAPALVGRLAADTGKALSDPGVSKSLLDQGLTPSDLSGPKLRAFIADEMKRYAGFFKETGITAEQ
jgi:tripartite-type tricarboxylate transporter receptor subunit TctC